MHKTGRSCKAGQVHDGCTIVWLGAPAPSPPLLGGANGAVGRVSSNGAGRSTGREVAAAAPQAPDADRA